MDEFEFVTDQKKLRGVALKVPPVNSGSAVRFESQVLLFSRQGSLLTLLKPAQSKEDRPRWDMPGGGVDAGETFIEAADRELREELNLAPSGYYIPFSFSARQIMQGHSFATMTFLATFPDEISPMVNRKEHIGFEWQQWGNIRTPRTHRLHHFLNRHELAHLDISDLVAFAKRNKPLHVDDAQPHLEAVTPPLHPLQPPSLEG